MIDHPALKPWLIFGILGCSLALNLVMVLDRDGGSADAAPAPGAAPLAPGEAPAPAGAPAALPGAAPAPAVGVAEVAAPPVDAAAAAVAAAPAAAPAPTLPVPAGWQVHQGEVNHSLARTFQGIAGEDGDALSQVFARLFVWDMDLRRDLQKGDRVEVAWRRDATGTIEVLAARYHSLKLGRSIAAYRWQAPGDAFTSYWQEDGTEVPLRLKETPLKDYEQITSLLKDRPSHAGIDFKVPVGTPVLSPRGGVVTRTNWSWKGNGNCVEVRFDDGVTAKFLHLAEVQVKDGQRVAAGASVGLSGNTGRSTAPHLHYQLERGEQVLDPFEYHGSVRRKVDGASLQAMLTEAARLDGILNQPVASR